MIGNFISLLSLFAFSNPPSPPFSKGGKIIPPFPKGGMIESPFPKGDNQDAKCPPSRGYHTRRHRADFLLTSHAITSIVDGSEDTMKKAIAFLALVLLVASFAAAQDWFKGSLDNAVAKAKSENKRVLLDFFSGG
jgi:hypothetical protein